MIGEENAIEKEIRACQMRAIRTPISYMVTCPVNRRYDEGKEGDGMLNCVGKLLSAILLIVLCYGTAAAVGCRFDRSEAWRGAVLASDLE